MSEFRLVLRRRIDEVQQVVTTAWKTGNHDRAQTYGAELADLLSLAASPSRHDRLAQPSSPVVRRPVVLIEAPSRPIDTQRGET